PPSSLGQLHLLRLEDERAHPEPLDDQIIQDLIPELVPAFWQGVRRLVRRDREAELHESPAGLLSFLSRGLRRIDRPAEAALPEFSQENWTTKELLEDRHGEPHLVTNRITNKRFQPKRCSQTECRNHLILDPLSDFSSRLLPLSFLFSSMKRRLAPGDNGLGTVIRAPSNGMPCYGPRRPYPHV